jgi:hypothetical protein
LDPLVQKKTDYTGWKRWVELDKHFPKPKYNFSGLLKRIGDYVETYPMIKEDRIRFKDAAKFWAYHHKKRVRIQQIPDYQDGIPMWRMRVTLISQHRNREFPEL